MPWATRTRTQRFTRFSRARQTAALNAEVTWEAVACDDPEVGFKGPNDYVGDCPVSSVNSFDELQSAADPQWS